MSSSAVGAYAASETVGRFGSPARLWPNGEPLTKPTILTGACGVEEDTWLMPNYVIAPPGPPADQRVSQVAGPTWR